VISKGLKSSEVASILGCSRATVVVLKGTMGYLKGRNILESDLDRAKEVYAKWLERKKQRNSISFHKDHFDEAVKIIKEEGCIEKHRLLKIFNTTNIAAVNSYFDKTENYLYDEPISVVPTNENCRRTQSSVYNLVSEYYKRVDEENALIGIGRPPKNGHIRTNARGV